MDLYISLCVSHVHPLHQLKLRLGSSLSLNYFSSSWISKWKISHHKTNSFYLLSYLTVISSKLNSYIPGCSGMFSSRSGMDQLLFFRPLVLPYLVNTKEPVTYNTSPMCTTLKTMTIFNSLIRWWKKKKIRSERKIMGYQPCSEL